MINKYFKFLIIVLAVAVIVPQVALASWWNPMSWGWLNSIFHFQQTQQKQEQQNKIPAVGGGKDAHGCIGSAGFTWCEVKQKCLRSWEEKCEATTADPTAGWKTYTNSQYGFEVKYPGNWKYQNVSCTYHFVVFCPTETKGNGMGGIAPSADCGMTCNPGNTTPTPIFIYLGNNMSASSLQYYNSQYKQIYDQMFSTVKFTK